MTKAKKLFSILFASMLIMGIVAYVSEEPHDHETYLYKDPPSLTGYTTFIICGDSSLVTKHNGTHLDFIPENFKEHMD